MLKEPAEPERREGATASQKDEGGGGARARVTSRQPTNIHQATKPRPHRGAGGGAGGGSEVGVGQSHHAEVSRLMQLARQDP